MGEKGLFNFEKLNNSNYSAWAFKMQMFLMKENCWESIEDENLLVMSDEMTTKDKRAWNFIVLGVDDGQHIHVKGTKGGREAWEKLKEFHIQTTLSARIRIMKRLFRVHLEDGVTMHEHIQYIFERFNELNEIGYGLDNNMAVSIMLASLNADYEPLITALEAWDENRLTIQAVRAKLIEEWQRKTQTGRDEVNEAALRSVQRPYRDRVTGGESRDRVFRDERICYGCNKRGHLHKDCRFKTRESNERASVARVAFTAKFENVEKRIHQRNKMLVYRTCYNCREYGHNVEMCPTKKNVKSVIVNLPQNNELNKKVDSAKMARLSQMYSFVSNNLKSNDWIIDSGASNHMCCDENLFQSLKRGTYGDIVIASGDKMKTKGRGTIKMFIGSEQETIEVTLLDVLFVPDLEANLLSVEKMTKMGFSVNFSNSVCHLNGKFGSCLIGKHMNGVYEVIQPKHNCSMSQVNSNCIHEWHKILAHRHVDDIKMMMRLGFKVKECNCSNVCDACVKGKMSRLSFPKVSEKKKNRLECIVSDVCGPMQTRTISHAKYFITFTDLFSGYTEVSFMKSKDESAEKTMQFIEKLKTQLGEKPKVFRSDRGGEYLNLKLQQYLKDEGIEFQCTVSYSPQQNGVAERKNRTLMEAARTLLIESELPNKFWAEAVHNANHTFNRVPRKKLQKTPFELLFNKVPVFDFHKFGSDVYVMVPYQKRRKLDNKAEQMRFLGHDDMSKGFRVLDANGVIRISRDVRFIDYSPDEVTDKETENKKYDENENNDINENSENEQENISETDYESDLNNESDCILIEPDQSIVTNDPQTISSPPITRSRSKDNGSGNCALYKASAKQMHDPMTYKEAMSSEKHHEWAKAINEEIKSIEENKTWTLTNLPPGRKSIGSKWVFKSKRDENGDITRYKARLVAQGFTQKFGVDYDEVFAPVARSTSLRVLLSVAGKKNYTVKHFDVKTAFLNGKLEEVIFMRPPAGFNSENNKVFELHKSLYGLKQAARVWNLTLHNELLKIGFVQSNADKCLYVFHDSGKVCYLLVHVDDIILASNDNSFLDYLASQIGEKFDLKSLGIVQHYLGIDIERDSSGNFLMSQSPYIKKIIEAANLSDAKPSKYPLDQGYLKIKDSEYLKDNDEFRKLIGMLLYLTTHSRPDIAASVSILSQKISKPNQTDMNEVMRVIRYLKGTQNLKLRLSHALGEQQLHSFSDANWAEDRESRKSNSGYFCSVNGGAIAWSCRKQDVIALSSTEAEYVALSETCKETVWLKRLMNFFGDEITSEIIIFTDSQSCMKMIENDKFSNRTKHVHVKYHFTRDLVSQREIKLCYVETENNIADLFTKPLGPAKIRQLREQASLIEVSGNIEGKC